MLWTREKAKTIIEKRAAKRNFSFFVSSKKEGFENIEGKEMILVTNFLPTIFVTQLKGGPSDLGMKIYKNTEKSPYTPKAF